MDSRYFRLAGLFFMIQLAIHPTKAFEIEHIYAHEIKNAHLSYVAIVDDKDGDHNNAAEELNGADADNALSGLDNNSILGGINDENTLKHANEKTANAAILKPHAPSRKIIGTKVNPLVNEESDMNELGDSYHGQDPKKETGKENTLGTHHKHGVLWDEPVQGGALEHKTGGVMERKTKPSVQVAEPKAGIWETKPEEDTREQDPTDINNGIQKGQDKQNSIGEYRNDYPHQDADKLRKYLNFNNGLSRDDIGDMDENKNDIFGHTVAHGNADNSVNTDTQKNENGLEKENTLGSDRQPLGACGPNKALHLDAGLSQNGLHNIARSNKAELNVNQENASKPLTIFESNKNLGVQKEIGNKLTNVETYVFFPNLKRRAEPDCNTTTTPCTTTTTPPPTTTCETTTTPCTTTTTLPPTTTCETTTTPCTTTTTLPPTTTCETTTTPCPTTTTTTLPPTTTCETTTTPCPTTTTPCPTTTTTTLPPTTTCETTTTPCKTTTTTTTPAPTTQCVTTTTPCITTTTAAPTTKAC